MDRRISIVVGALAAAAWFAPAQLAVAQANVSFTLEYGVLAGLTGDPAPSGQGWNEAARLGFTRMVIPAVAGRHGAPRSGGIELVRTGTVAEAIEVAVG